jgi:hypothetical protein
MIAYRTASSGRTNTSKTPVAHVLEWISEMSKVNKPLERLGRIALVHGCTLTARFLAAIAALIDIALACKAPGSRDLGKP